MNIRGMRIFVSVMEEGSLARASHRNHLSQPAASRLLRLFEEVVGEPLFFRAGKKLVPTQEADLLYPEAVRILDAFDCFPKLIASVREDSLLPIRILCLPRIVDGLVLPAMARLHELEPKQRFKLEINTRREMGRRLTHGDYDVGVATTPIPVAGVESHLLTEIRLQIMLPLGHPLSDRELLEPQDVLAHSYVALNEDTAIRRTIEDELRQSGYRLEATHEASSSTAAYNMVRHGMGFTFADPLSVEPELLKHVHLRPWVPATTLRIVYFYPRGTRKHTNRDRFVDQLKELFHERRG